MDLKPDFTFRPLPPVENPSHLPFPGLPNPLGPLSYLPGTWAGHGFNTIWRPVFNVPNQDRFLELNLTDETNEFAVIGGGIPNRGLLQPDLVMFGVHYLQQISDANVPGNPGLHIEPGIWLAVPATTDPQEPPTVVRMASIPHGTTILAQGTSRGFEGPPDFPFIDITPIDNRDNSPLPFPEKDLSLPSNFRSQPPQIDGITQAMVDNPSVVLANAIAGQKILATTELKVTTHATSTALGGGTANTAFLTGAQGSAPNADAVRVDSTFWIELVEGSDGLPAFHQLQYAQIVFLVFHDVTWPHATVGTLRQTRQVATPLQRIDPDIPVDLIRRIDEGS
jgi:hypothetical protein